MEDRFAAVAALLVVSAMLISISCAGETGEQLPNPQAAAVTSPVPTPVATSAQAPTAILAATPFPTTTSTPEPTALPTPVSTSTATPLPEPTAIPTLTPEPTLVPTATSKPTLPPRPTPTPWPTLTPAPTATPVPLGPYGSIQTGPEVVGMDPYDRLISEFMDKRDLPGGAIAVVKDGRLVFARGYGLADIQSQEPIQPDSLFRIASLSKQVTAVAVLKLVEDGKLDLDARAFEILSDFREPEGSTRDPRLDQITVRHLLHHAGGWDKNESYDPMWSVWRTEEGIGALPPITCSDVIHFMLGQPLDFDPGTRYAYANFGYCMLGRVIEAVSGQEYEEFVREHVLKPIGIARMWVGGTRLEERLDDEVRYYPWRGQDPAWSVFPEGPSQVPWPYGGFYLEGQDAHGGWVGSAIDLVRFVTALDGSKYPTVLEPETVDLMLARPRPQLQDTPYYYGLGWAVRPVGDAKTWWHFGSQPGTTALIVRAHHGLTWVTLFNLQPQNLQEAQSELNQLLWRATEEVTTWPSHDLFSLFGYE